MTWDEALEHAAANSIRGAITRRQALVRLGAAGMAATMAGGCARSGGGVGRAMSEAMIGAGGGPVVGFDFGCARRLYAEGAHPRLLLSAEDLVRLRRRCAGGWCAALLDRLRQRTAPMIAGVLGGKIETATPATTEPSTAPATQRSKPDRDLANIGESLDDIALVGVLDGNEEAIEAARRVLISRPGFSGGASAMLAYDLIEPRLSPADRAGFIEHTAGLVRRYMDERGETFLLGAGANMGSTALFLALMRWLSIVGDAGAPPMESEGKLLLLHFEASLYSTFGASGYPNEDMGYGTMMAGRLARAATCLRRAGLYDAYTRCPRFARFGSAVLHFVQPWGEFLSNTGDHSDEFAARELALAHLARHRNDPTLTWLLGTLAYPNLDADQRELFPGDPLARTTVAPGMSVATSAVSLIVLPDAPRPVHPRDNGTPTAFMDPDRGIVSLRSGWRDDDTFVYLDGSQRPSGALGHAHDSGGHFALTALGEYFAVSPGRYGVEQDQHNLVLIDGKSGRGTDGNWGPSPYHSRLIAYRPGSLCDHAATDHSHQSNRFWSFRHLGLVKDTGLPRRDRPAAGYVWIVDDVNADNGLHEYWWTMHTDPRNTIELRDGHAVVHGWRRRSQLLVHFALPAATRLAPPHKLTLAQDVTEFGSPRYVSRHEAMRNAFHGVHHAVYFRPRLIGKITGFNGFVMTLLTPRRHDAPAPRVEALPTHVGALAMRVMTGEFHDTIIWGGAHHLLEADGVIGRGPWIVVRRSHDSGRVLACEAPHCDRLEVDGKVVVRENHGDMGEAGP